MDSIQRTLARLSLIAFAVVAPASALAQQTAGVPGSPNATTAIPGNQLPPHPPKFGGFIQQRAEDSIPWWPPRTVPPKGAPNVLLILTDDAGRLNTRPARTPVNASLSPLRTMVHDSGPMWVANPSTYATLCRFDRRMEDDMIRTVEIKRCLAVTLSATIAVAAAAPVSAEEDKSDGKWHFTVTPYLWLPDISGTVTYTNPAGAGGSVTSQVDPSSYLESLDFAAMFTAEGRKDNWLVFTDYMYLHLGGHESAVQSVTGPGGIVTEPINTGGSTKIVGNIWTLAGGYGVVHKPDVSLDLFAGTRLLSLPTSLSWSFSGPTGGLAQSGNVSQTLNEWDGIVGLKGEVRFGESKWFMPFYGDIGAGSSNSTWQATGPALGASFRF